MQFVMIFSLVIAVIAVMFAMQNTAVVTLKFFIWTFESPLALLLIIALTVGAIITSIFTLPGWFKTKKFHSRHDKEINDLEESLSKYRTDLIDTQNKNKDLRQKIFEIEEAKEKLEKAHGKTEEEIEDLKEALSDAKLTAEEAQIARKEAQDARDEIDAALKEMDAKISASFPEESAQTTVAAEDSLPNEPASEFPETTTEVQDNMESFHTDTPTEETDEAEDEPHKGKFGLW